MFPGAKLDVNGSLRANGKILARSYISDGDTVVPADYVFEEDYALTSLEQLREFVGREGQLPNLPTADDIKQNGLNLSEMQMGLLEKIEELVLYTFEQDDQLQSQRQRIESLEASADDQGQLLGRLGLIEGIVFGVLLLNLGNGRSVRSRKADALILSSLESYPPQQPAY